jgi:hypothetical protein
MNILQRAFFEEKRLYYVLFAIILWFIMATIYTLNKVLEKSVLEDTNVQIVAVRRKKTAVFGKN